VDDFIAMGVEAVTFSGGGEPLIYKPIAEAVTRLAQAGIRVAALSNGANLKGKVADAFAEHGTWLRVSMDGWDDASYAESRGVKLGEFSRVIANLRAFAQRQSRCVLGVSFIVSQRNVGHIEDICRLLKDVGVNHVKISAAIVSNDVHENNLYHQAIMAEATQQIERAMTLASDGFAVLNHYHETEERFDKEYRSCPYVRLLTIVGADCNVYTCQDKAYNDAGKLGSIAERS
ncbi:MAG: radical SAM protein, partial [Rhodospirillaceae bacterium]